MLPGRTYTPANVLRILRRRLWLLIGSGVVMGLLAAQAARAMPNVFAAYTTILAMPPRVSEKVVRPVIAESLEQRLINITPQILNPERLESIIVELDLYPELRKVASTAQIVETMRASISGPTVVRADAFRIGYSGFWPEKVMQVTARLGDLFIDENVKSREKIATDTNDFLESQLEDTRKRLLEQEQRLQLYRTANAASMPSQLAPNMQLLGVAQAELKQTQDALRRARDRRADLDERLAQAEQMPAAAAERPPNEKPPTDARPSDTAAAPPADTPPADAPPSPPAEQATGEPGDPASSPDLNFGAPGTPVPVRLRNARIYLDSLKLRLRPAHPDVVRVQRIVEQLERAAQEQAKQTTESMAKGGNEAVRSAMILTARRALAVVDKEIAALEEEEARHRRTVVEYQGRVDSGPAHEARMTELSRDYEILRKSYQDLLAKKEESGIASDLERQHVGQQFRVVEPARLPTRPTFPNRPRIVSFGFASGVVLGLVLSVLLELRDHSFRSAPEVVQVLSLPIVAMVPPIATRYERRRFLRRIAWSAAGMVAIVLLIGVGLLALRNWW